MKINHKYIEYNSQVIIIAVCRKYTLWMGYINVLLLWYIVYVYYSFVIICIYVFNMLCYIINTTIIKSSRNIKMTLLNVNIQMSHHCIFFLPIIQPIIKRWFNLYMHYSNCWFNQLTERLPINMDGAKGDSTDSKSWFQLNIG